MVKVEVLQSSAKYSKASCTAECNVLIFKLLNFGLDLLPVAVLSSDVLEPKVRGKRDP